MNSQCLYCDHFIQAEMTWTKLFFSSREKRLCGNCSGKLEHIHGDVCTACSRPLALLDPKYIHGTVCHDCFRWEEDPEWCGVLGSNVSVYQYNDFLKELLARFKYRGDYALAKVFAEDVRTALSKLVFDLLVPIPLSPERLLERGFNQAKALAEEAGFQSAEVLQRIHGEKQSKKSRNERIHLPQVFAVKRGADVSGKKIVLMDDIYTTGSTLRHAGRVLKKAGAKSVKAFTLARG
ncbi:ComF family protein [Siminovitchia sp. 179-K 8D1 HS]|uniref:ComF family protein n=1 Tax=Siminovitchia sp. 179-K 8D1 HS TaxID=3142385 RepID=UPI00399F93F4